MSKSATEQFQIKTKRKRSDNNSNHSNNNNNNNCNTSNINYSSNGNCNNNNSSNFSTYGDQVEAAAAAAATTTIRTITNNNINNNNKHKQRRKKKRTKTKAKRLYSKVRSKTANAFVSLLGGRGSIKRNQKQRYANAVSGSDSVSISGSDSGSGSGSGSGSDSDCGSDENKTSDYGKLHHYKRFLTNYVNKNNNNYNNNNHNHNNNSRSHSVTAAAEAEEKIFGCENHIDFCLRDQRQVVVLQPEEEEAQCTPRYHTKKMPLSQAFYSKSAHATRRGGVKALRVCGDGKRRENNPTTTATQQQQQQQQQHRHLSQQQQQQKQKAYSIFDGATQRKQQLLGSGGGVGGRGGAGSLQLSYLLGESLAHHGRLQEAFDIYAFIASEHLDGCIPLDRLSTLALALIHYVRQLSNKVDATSTIEEQQAMESESETSGGGGVGPLESPLKTKYAKQHATEAAWSTASCLATPPSTKLAATDVLGGELDLYAPSREFAHMPSAALASEELDPLMCPLCRDVLRCPVTTNCGHTFCRQCCDTITHCNICHIKFPRSTLDDFIVETHGNKTGGFLSTTTTSISASMPHFSVGNLNLNANNPSPPTTRPFNLLGSGGGVAGVSIPNTNSTGELRVLATPSAAAVAAATTVTTTSVVSSTTATATTTMASTSGLNGTLIGASTAGHIKFMPDVLVRRLVEKWWGPELQAKKINETAASYMYLNLLDDALKFCNASLEKSPTNFKSLLLRAEVLRKLRHFQSSLADIENALKVRNNSAKAHYMRALALCELGRYEEALYNNCVAISLDKTTHLTSSELFQHDLAKVLQKLLAQSTTSKPSQRHGYYTATPYGVPRHRLRRKQMSLLSNANGDHYSSAIYGMDDCDVDACDGDDVDVDVEVAAYEFMTEAAYDVAAAVDGDEYEELSLKRRGSRKHIRRKWLRGHNLHAPMPPPTSDLLPPLIMPCEEAPAPPRTGALLRGIVQRAQQEWQCLHALETSGDWQRKQLAQVSTTLIDASDFDCVLCCRTFWKPVVTPCGHTYCWVCLDRCMDYTSSCPLCMSPLLEPHGTGSGGSPSPMTTPTSPVPFVLAKRSITKFLEAAMRRFIPEQYENRFRQEMNLEPSVPMFICTTAFPHVPCPLFVYEPRYRLMVRRAVESGEKQFGIVQPHSGKSRYFDVGTILDIRDCVLLGDGCSILSTIGCKRFRILARNEKDGYETAKVEYICDESIADENVQLVSNMHATVLGKAIDWFDRLSEEFKQEILQSFGEMPAVEDNWETIADGPAWAWWIIALLPLHPQLKVDILATTSLEKRLRAIEKTLDYLSGSFRRSQQNCGVVVCQPQQQQQQQAQHDHAQHVDDEDCNDSNHNSSNHNGAATQSGLTTVGYHASDTDECCLIRTTNAGSADSVVGVVSDAAAAGDDDAGVVGGASDATEAVVDMTHTASGERHHSQLML